MNYTRRVVLSLGIMLASFATLSLGQDAHRRPKVSDPSTILREAMSQGSQSLPVLDTGRPSASFSLVTSWIAGEKHLGYIRYQVHAYGEGVSLTEAPKYVEQLHACSYTLLIYDKGHFLLQRIPLTFMRTVSDGGLVVAMDANDMSQMDLADYQSFIASSTWNISWSCS